MDQREAVQRCNCGGVACKSAKVSDSASGGGWQPRVAGGGKMPNSNGDRMIADDASLTGLSGETKLGT